MKYQAADLPALLERINRNTIGMDEYFDRIFKIHETTSLFVEGQKEDKETESNYIHKGLAQRSFKRVWTLADDTEVADVSFEDGLLSINLKKIVPDHHKRKDYL